MDLETLLKNTSRSLYLSIRVLPNSIRNTFAIAYLLCRYADTIADTSILLAKKRLFWIEKFPEIIEKNQIDQAKILAREIAGGSENSYERILIGRLEDCLKVFTALPKEHKVLVLEVVGAVCDGMRIDLTQFPPDGTEPASFQTCADLEYYCRLMGGMPGLFWSKLIYLTSTIQVSEQEFYDWGKHIGDALQIVNILRDLPKDIQIGRSYFPREDLDKHGLFPTQLKDSSFSSSFEPVKRKWISWGLARIEKGSCYFSKIPKSQIKQRISVAWPILWTVDTFSKLASSTNLLDKNKRVKIPRSRIYFTMFLTPFILVSNSLFVFWLDYKIKKVRKLLCK